MTTRSWILIDQARQVHLEQLTITPSDVGGSASNYLVEMRTLRGGLSDQVVAVKISSGALACTVLPTRGMNLWKAWLGGEEFGWQSPVPGPVHPSLVPVSEPGGLGWLDGFDELLARCGLESNGAPDFDATGRLRYPLHGRISNKPAHLVTLQIDGQTGEISLTGVVDECRFHFSKLRLTSTVTLRPGQPRIQIRDDVQNLSDSASGMQLLYHINFGPPLLGPGTQLVAPVHTLVPRNSRATQGIASWNGYGTPEGGFEEQVYFLRLLADQTGGSHVLLKNAAGNRGASLQFNTSQLPCFTLWKNTTALADGYVTGLEPGTNFPNPRSYEQSQNRVVMLPPGGTQPFALDLLLHGDTASVGQAEETIRWLQSHQAPTIHETPQAGWCAL